MKSQALRAKTGVDPMGRRCPTEIIARQNSRSTNYRMSPQEVPVRLLEKLRRLIKRETGPRVVVQVRIHRRFTVFFSFRNLDPLLHVRFGERGMVGWCGYPNSAPLCLPCLRHGSGSDRQSKLASIERNGTESLNHLQ